jgi:MAP kinase interacting serine/threonine kinase
MPNQSNVTDNDGQKKKRKRANSARIKTFAELYTATGETLGEGAFGQVRTFMNTDNGKEFAVKRIEMNGRNTRSKVLKEIELFYQCKGHENILQLIEYFEEGHCFYLVFEKMSGGSLLETIENRGHLTEQEASLVIRDIACALSHLHRRGIAHRDLKPENILCVTAGQLSPVKLCDFDLGSGLQMSSQSPVSTPELQSPVGSAEFMAPEVLDVWQDQAWSYDKRCDLWSLGIILYILLCGYPPFCGNCGRDCGWENGATCMQCQEQLFESIQEGVFGFPEKEWKTISASAKDLIGHLLVRDPHLRYSADEVLRHPWLTLDSPQAQLATPRILLRNNSVRELGLFTETANAVNRLLLSHLSISESSDPVKVATPGQGQGHGDDDDDDFLSMTADGVMFQFESSGDESVGSISSLKYYRPPITKTTADSCCEEIGESGEDAGKDELDGQTTPRMEVINEHCRLRETQLSGDSGFTSSDTLSPRGFMIGDTHSPSVETNSADTFF